VVRPPADDREGGEAYPRCLSFFEPKTASKEFEKNPKTGGNCPIAATTTLTCLIKPFHAFFSMYLWSGITIILRNHLSNHIHLSSSYLMAKEASGRFNHLHGSS